MGDIITLCEEILESDTFGSIIVPERESTTNHLPSKKSVEERKITSHKAKKIEISTNTEPSINKSIDELNAKISKLENDNKILKNNNKKLLDEIKEYKSNKEIDMSKNELISKKPIDNNGVDVKRKLILNAKGSLKQSNQQSQLIKFKDSQKSNYSKLTKTDHWKFCIYPYFLIKRNNKLFSIKDEICSIFSIENLLETIKLLGSFHSLKNEFQEQAIQNEMIINNVSRIKRFNDCEERSKFELAKFSELMNDK